MPTVTEALTRWLKGNRARDSFAASGRLREAESEGAITKGSHTGPLIAYETLGQPVWAPRDYATFAREGFMQNAIVYRSVRMIGEAAATIPLLLYEGDTEIESHPLLDLIRRPSLDHTGTDFFESWYGFLLVAGNAYVEAVALDGELRELHILRPDRMKVIPGPDGWPEGYEYTAGGQSIRFHDEPVAGVRPILHVRLFHPANDHYGMSPIEAAATAIDIHNTASGWNKALLDNSARPSGALVYAAANGQMTGEQFERLKSELETSFQGARHAGRPLLLEGGLDWKPLSLTPKDMDFIEAKNSAAREIALALGVPPMLLGIPGDNTYSNYQEAQRAFWRQTVLPLVNRMAQGFSSWLAPAYGGALTLKPDLDQIEALAGEREALWARLEAASFLTDDEKRAAAGYGALLNAPDDSAARSRPSGAGKEAANGGTGPFDGATKYRPDQPRVAAGNPDGGQWTDGGGGQIAGPLAASNLATDAARNAAKWLGEQLTKTPQGRKQLQQLEKLLGSKTAHELPEFLVKREGVAGKIVGKLEDLTPAEQSFVKEIRDLGHEIEIVPRGASKTPDFKINGVSHELKTVSGVEDTSVEGLSKAIKQRIFEARSQAENVIVDGRNQAGMTREAADRAVKRAYGLDNIAEPKIKSITILTQDGIVYAPRR